ncbi:MAG: IclR family transcriptional regulator [bacterium]
MSDAIDDQTGPGTAAGSRSVTARALALLAAFDVSHPRLTLTELSRRSGLPMATAHRLANELEQWRALERDDEGRYSIGFRLWEIGLLSSVHSRLREVALPSLLALQRTTNLTVQLAACDGFDAIYVEKLTSNPSVPVASRIGARLPLHATGAGKALLAFQSSAFLEALLQRKLTRYTEHTIVTRAALRRELARIRTEGLASSWQEYRSGSCSLAVPVLVDGDPAASVGLVSYELRDDLDDHADALHQAARSIASRIELAGDDPLPNLEPEPAADAPAHFTQWNESFHPGLDQATMSSRPSNTEGSSPG